ncbi:MAG: hypothetical protein V1781_04470 [Bacteroidota bacterium]
MFKDNKIGVYDTTLQKIAYISSNYYYHNQFDSSAYYYEKLIKSNPEKYTLYYNQAVDYASLGNVDKAMKSLKQYYSKGGDNCHCSFMKLNPRFISLAENKSYKKLINKCYRVGKHNAKKMKISRYELSDTIQFYLGRDQEILNSPRYIDGNNKQEKDSLLKMNLFNLLNNIDTTFLPVKSEIGIGGTGALHVLFLHVDYLPSVQYSIANKMLSMGQEKGYSMKNAAYLLDRSLRNMHKPQLYGTIISPSTNGKRELYPVDNIEKVKQRRKELGFQPLEESLKNYSITK